MRAAICLLLFLGGLVWIGARVDIANSAATSVQIIESPWRRTKDGWQRADDWPNSQIAAESPHAGLFSIGQQSLPHPLVVALFLFLASMWCLLASTPVLPSPPRGRGVEG